MQPKYCIYDQGKETYPIRINREPTYMSIQSEVDQLLPYMVFSNLGIRLC